MARLVLIGVTFQRPAETTVYTLDDIIPGSTVEGSVEGRAD